MIPPHLGMQLSAAGNAWPPTVRQSYEEDAHTDARVSPKP